MAEDTRIRIENITPEPPEDVVVAIGLALEAGWPQPRPAVTELNQSEINWRFSQRPWKPRRHKR